ncbi:CHAT domain-containing protein [Saccharothrix coeruleofusca]|uniref:CHAT domain-containing protein n=1 Tax=Saccharothrix coeruleofusca TaxID=33919 RepID=A0A918ALJ6_9PSEU|nr:CHAT domain-containing protein [Saccharothrix coeruleofusca]GGP56631.1 CHAT domain-containing protein [Saccharothrix coeruleofusca]
MSHDDCLALVESGQLARAQRVAEEGLRAASRDADGDRAGFRLTLAWIALDRGDPAACARHLDAVAAEAGATVRHLARARCLRGLLLCQQADPRLAVKALTAAVRRLRGDHRWQANALIGRGIARCYAVRPAEADADFAAARALLLSIGEPERAAMALHNRGFAAVLAGDHPAALRHYERAAREGLRVASKPEALVDRAQALLAAGLVAEAREVLRPAVALLDRCDRGSRLPEALLLAGRCALRDDDPAAARDLAARAATMFRAQGRAAWVPAATAVALRAGAQAVETAVEIAAACDAHGHHEDAAELRLATGALVEAAARRHRGTARARALGWLARARLAGDRRAAVAACRAGLALQPPDQHPGPELVAIALDHALAAGDAMAVVRWAEHRRADPPAPVPATARPSAELRLARARDDHDGIVRLEREIRRLSLAAGTDRRHRAFPDPAALGERALLHFTSHRGRLVAVSVVAGRVRLRDAGDARRFDHHVRSLALGRNATAIRELDGLTAPAGDRPLVVVPSPELERLPWAALPSCRGRAVSVAPSAACWLRAARTPLALDRRLWVAGPGLRHAVAEVRALRRRHGGTRRSTVESTLDALARADVAHIAAHGEFRAGSPLFSHLRLADGPLHGHDLDRLERAPAVVVLSACHSGLAPLLLRRGARAVIACVRDVPDARAPALMATLHAALGTGPAQALADAQAEHGDLGFSCFGAG